MNILVLLRMTPDVVEELELDAGGKALDQDVLRMILSETDDHALEEALLLKERHGGTVTAVGLDAPEIDDTLFTALAKGADRAVKVTDAETGGSTRAAAAIFSQVVDAMPAADLILTGAQAIDDLDGLVAPLVAYNKKLPYLGTVTQVAPESSGKAASVVREYSGGVRGEFRVPLPAVLGIQAAEKPPRYVPVAKVRNAMKTLKIEDTPAASMVDGGLPVLEVISMAKPETGGHAEMIEGEPEEVAIRICDTLAARGLL
jgi:electron transfer flavoprotein beta subunit